MDIIIYQKMIINTELIAISKKINDIIKTIKKVLNNFLYLKHLWKVVFLNSLTKDSKSLNSKP